MTRREFIMHKVEVMRKNSFREFMNKVEEIRKNSLELSAQVGIGGSGYNSGDTNPKYPNVPYLHYEEDFKKEQDRLYQETGSKHHPHIPKSFSICAHYDVLHANLLAVIEAYGPNYQALRLVYKTAVRSLEQSLLKNCSYEYQDEVKNAIKNGEISI